MQNCESKKLYCLSGLGVDKRVFANLELPEVELVHIDWIPAQKNESLEAYSKRLFNSIELPEDYNLLGVSFGGMIAIEFAKLRPPRHLFLISTLITVEDLPPVFRFATKLEMHRIVPASFLKSPNVFTYRFFGITKPDEKRLLQQILRDTDPKFLKWALAAIAGWKNKHRPPSIMIHGSRDRILPATEKVDHIIPAGGHFMIVTHAKEIAKLISIHNAEGTIMHCEF